MFVASMTAVLTAIVTLSSSILHSCEGSIDFTLDAGPHHMDLLRVVRLDSRLRDIDSLNEGYPSNASPWVDAPESSAQYKWIATGHHRTNAKSSVLHVKSGPFATSSDILDDLAEKLNVTKTGGIEVTAHPVNHAIRQDEPILRVLFHATTKKKASCYDHLDQTKDCQLEKDICITSRLEKEDVDGENTAYGSCVIKAGELKPMACLSQILVPVHWWSLSRSQMKRAVDNSLEDDGESSFEIPPQILIDAFISLHFSAFYVDKPKSCVASVLRQRRFHKPEIDYRSSPSFPLLHSPFQRLKHQQYNPNEQTTTNSLSSKEPSVLLSSNSVKVPIVWSDAAYVTMAESSDAVRMTVPFTTIHPGSILHVPVMLEPNSGMDLFTIKTKVKKGLDIIGSEVFDPKRWETKVKSRNRAGSFLVITASRKPNRSKREMRQPGEKMVRVFTIVFQVSQEKVAESKDVRITWTVEYGQRRNTSQTLLHISNDEIQALVPVVKKRTLLNTALCDGHAIVEPMKVFAISHTGLIQDISAKSTCHSQSRDTLKVSKSCNIIYFDGSETHGFSNVTVLAKYSHYLGYTTVGVWVPQLPLQVVLSDHNLNQIRGWKVPNEKGSSKQKLCSQNYQQSVLRVYARFLTDSAALAATPTAHRKWLLEDNAVLDVTSRVKMDVRASDPRVVQVLRHRSKETIILAGRSSGRTKVQVVSPLTGKILGSAELQVSNERVDVIGTRISVVSGLDLLALHKDIEPGLTTYIASFTKRHHFHGLSQEGSLEITLLFSDGTVFPVEWVSSKYYSLTVNSLANQVVAIILPSESQSKNQTMPKLIATGQGSGDFVYVALDSPDECLGKRKSGGSRADGLWLSRPLTADYVSVTVGQGISTDYDSDVWAEGDAFDGFLNDGSHASYPRDFASSQWESPLGGKFSLQDSLRIESFSPDKKTRSYAYEEFSKLGAVKESRNRKKLLRDDLADMTSSKSVSRISNFDRWDSKKLQDPQDYLMAGVTEQRVHALNEGKGLSNLEIGLYALLVIFGIAISVFAVNCAIYVARNKRLIGKLGLSTDDDDNDVGTEDGSEDFTHVPNEWVWMSKEQLEEKDIPVECTQRLMPEAEFVAQTLQRELPPHHPGPVSLSRVNSRSSSTGRPRSHAMHKPPLLGLASLPVAGHHRGSLPECHQRSRASSTVSRASHRTSDSTSSRHGSFKRDHPASPAFDLPKEDEIFYRSNEQGGSVNSDGSLRSHGSMRSHTSSLMSVTLNPMDEVFSRQLESPVADEPSMSSPVPQRCYSPSLSGSPPSSPFLAGCPPGSPCLSSRPLTKQESITSSTSKVLGSICYDYKDRGISFDQMVDYFDHLNETPA